MNKIIMAAMKSSEGLIMAGRRHDEISVLVYKIFNTHLSLNWENGFITNEGVFVNRTIAAEIAIKAKQVKKQDLTANILFSEDLLK